MSTFRTRPRFPLTALVVLTVAVLAPASFESTFAMPPAPELLDRLKASGELPAVVEVLQGARERGYFRSNPNIIMPKDKSGERGLFDPANPDTLRVLVILVDFSDNPSTGGLASGLPSDFVRLLLQKDANDGTYSMAEFYRDNSYGGLHIEGQVVGWIRLPQTYAYYVDGQYGWGEDPHSVNQLVRDALTLADPLVDFSQFDVNADGWIDGLFMVHAGAGAEATGDPNMLWSHSGGIWPSLMLDGMEVWGYTMQPEEYGLTGLSTMGVYAHEYGHYLGLPDLYDYDHSSSGIGNWSLMAGGSWNAHGVRPAFMDAWCKQLVGFLAPVNVTSNMVDVPIASSYCNPVAYRLWAGGAQGPEYFIIENRQRIGFDNALPGSGLLIYHINENAPMGNDDEFEPLVAIEEADGRFDLRAGRNQGDGSDPWMTTTQTEFNDFTTPNSRAYSGLSTLAAVWGVPAADSVMYAGLEIVPSRPQFELVSGEFGDGLYGDGDGVVEAGETWTFVFTVMNTWAAGTNVTGSLVCDNNDILFSVPSVNIGTVAGFGGTGSNGSSPLVFTVPADFAACIDSFHLTVVADQAGSGREYGFELHVGGPGVLVVDDDGGASWEQAYAGTLRGLRTPFAVWEKGVLGTPPVDTLLRYESVIWFTGDDRAEVLSGGDVAVMKAFLDGGGNLFLTGQVVVRELWGEDPEFLSDYLKAGYLGDQYYPLMNGVAGSAIGGGYKIRYMVGDNQDDPQKMTVVNGSSAEFVLPVGGVTMLSWAGTYKVVVASFGFEAVADGYVLNGYADKGMVLGRILEFFRGDTVATNPVVSGVGVMGEGGPMRLTDHTPVFFWSVSDTAGLGVVAAEVQVGTGDLCYNRDDRWSPGVLGGGDTSVGYGGVPLEDGEGYVFRVRVFNGETWSGWGRLAFGLNAVGPSGQLVAPALDSVVTTGTPTLKVTNTVDPDGDVQTYEFVVYGDAGLTVPVAGAAGVTQSPPHTVWTVPTALADDARYWWRARAYDGYEYSAWSSVGTFLVSAENVPPGAFSLLWPADGDTVSGVNVAFGWGAAGEGDLGDGVTYTLKYGADSLFAAYAYVQLAETTVVLAGELAGGETYYWRVEARDRFSGVTLSEETFRLVTEAVSCCELRGDLTGDGSVKVSDLTLLIGYLFRGEAGPSCPEHGDVTGDGQTKVSDVTALVGFLFRGEAGPAPCP